jgi:hypothetical protein
MRHYVTYSILLALKGLTRLFYRVELSWLGSPPADRWEDHRLVVFLHHTSLYEPVFLAGAPNPFIRRVAFHGVLPAAEKTIRRPIVGWFFKMLAAHVISITRARDDTWFQVLSKIDPESMVILTPEGRMMRRNGLDSAGRPMTVRGGIADVLEAIGEGRMLIAYSGGLHHVQAPGERIPHLFQTVKMNLELVDIADYIRTILHGRTSDEFRRAVCEDLERRREANCPIDGPKPWPTNGSTPPRPSGPGVDG